MKFPRCFINGGSSLTPIHHPVKVMTNCGTLFPKRGTDYCFQMGKLEKPLVSSSDFRTRLAKASSSSIASFSRLFQKRGSQSWSAGGYDQFGAAHCVPKRLLALVRLPRLSVAGVRPGLQATGV
jgi:hypothetical protein